MTLHGNCANFGNIFLWVNMRSLFKGFNRSSDSGSPACTHTRNCYMHGLQRMSSGNVTGRYFLGLFLVLLICALSFWYCLVQNSVRAELCPAIPEKREMKKKWNLVFSIKDMHCQPVLTFLQSLIEWLTFCQNSLTYFLQKKTELPFSEFPYFLVLPSVPHTQPKDR